jgi:hypothetical protein
VDEELRQAIESVKEQQPVQVNLDWYQDTIKLPEIKEFIRANINSASRSFVAIGYYLKYVRDKQLHKEEGYENIWDFAKTEFGIGRSSASRFMAINDRFSKDGNSPVLTEQYKDFSSSKLSEMLTMTDDQLEQVSIGTTVAEIREIKQPEKPCATSHKEPKCFIRDQINKTHEEDLKCSGGISDDCNNCDKAEQIDALDFSVNTYNCLKRANIDTIEQLCNLTENKVIAIRNISRKCLDEIKLKLSEIGRGLKPDDITETVNNDPEIVDNEPEIVNDVDETVLLPCDTCGWDLTGCCDYDNEDMHCVCGDAWKPKEPDPVKTVEADIIQTVPEETLIDQCVTSGLKFNNWLKANGSSIADIVDVVLMSKKVPDEDNLYSQIKNGLISRLITKTEAYYSYLTSELGIEPERPKQIQPELPVLKNNDQRQEWLKNYRDWGIWYKDENVNITYYRFEFSDGSCIIVDEYTSWDPYNRKERTSAYYHIVGKVFNSQGDKSRYSHYDSSTTELIEHLKQVQKKGA